MDRTNIEDRHEAVCEWAKNFESRAVELSHHFTAADIAQAFKQDLLNYFALCGLSRRRTAAKGLNQKASGALFGVRTEIEKSIENSVTSAAKLAGGGPRCLFRNRVYGGSKKQGVSVRMPLTTCVPTALCATRCYAHDALDASSNSVIRGAMNGAIAQLYEEGGSHMRCEIMAELKGHSLKAIKQSWLECDSVEPGWTRRPHIRFAHVGEMAAYPAFANAVGAQIRDLSGGKVMCVVYTRHPRARELDPDLWVINFT